MTSRSIPRTSAPPNPVFLVGGILGILFLALLIIAVAASSSSGRKARPVQGQGEGPGKEPSVVEREALAKCEEGYTLILRSYPGGDRAGLQRGLDLVLEGMSGLERVNQSTGRKFDVKRYQEAQVMARRKLMELR